MRGAKTDRVGYLGGKAKLALQDNSRLYSSRNKTILKKSHSELPSKSPLKKKVFNQFAVGNSLLDIKVARIDDTVGDSKKVFMKPSININTKGQYYLGKKTADGGKSIKTAGSMNHYDTQVPMAVASPRELELPSPSGDLIPILHHLATIPALKLGNLPEQAYFFGKFESYGKNPYMPPSN